MNQFLSKFGVPIDNYWESTENERRKLLKDILEYANANRQTFINDFNQIKFDEEIMPLPIVLEALSADTETWGQLYVDLLNEILQTAKQTDKPRNILTYLQDFVYIEEDTSPFVQQIADRLSKELDAGNVDVKIACIGVLTDFLQNHSIQNRGRIIEKLRQQLFDKNWKIRVSAFESLRYEELLPVGHKLSIKDKLFKLIKGYPPPY